MRANCEGQGVRYYTASIGCAEVSGWFHSDDYARRVIQRWIRLFWRHVVARSPLGSVARWGNTHDPKVELYRYGWCPNGVIGNEMVRIDGWAVAENANVR